MNKKVGLSRPVPNLEDMRRQRNFEIIYKLLSGGVADDPSFARTPEPVDLQGDEAGKETIIKKSREQFTRDGKDVEGKIKRWFA